MDESYNDLTLKPNNPDAVTPPPSLSLPEQLAWITRRIEATRAWEKMLTPAYFQESRGPVLRELENALPELRSQVEKQDQEASVPPAPSQPKPTL